MQPFGGEVFKTATLGVANPTRLARRLASFFPLSFEGGVGIRVDAETNSRVLARSLLVDCVRLCRSGSVGTRKAFPWTATYPVILGHLRVF
jgi:hypothetical protein